MEENLKETWRDTRFQSATPQQMAEIIDGRRRTALEQLASRYKRFSNLGLLMMIIMPINMLNHNIFYDTPQGWKIAWMVLAAVYFGFVSLIDRRLYHGVNEIDCSMMSVKEVCDKAMFYRKRHLQSIIILLPMAILIVGGMIWLAGMNLYFLYGAIAGAIIGLVVGSRILMKFMADYRQFRD